MSGAVTLETGDYGSAVYVGGCTWERSRRVMNRFADLCENLSSRRESKRVRWDFSSDGARRDDGAWLWKLELDESSAWTHAHMRWVVNYASVLVGRGG